MITHDTSHVPETPVPEKDHTNHTIETEIQMVMNSLIPLMVSFNKKVTSN